MWGYCQTLPLLAEEYLNLASDVSESANAANGALDALVDAVLVAVAAVAVTSWTGFGAIVGEATAAAMIGKAIGHVKDYTGALGAIRDTVGIFTGLDTSYESPVTRLDSLTMPKP